MAQVPETSVAYVGDGTTVIYNFDFPYLTQVEVFATVNDVQVTFDFLSGNTIELHAAPAVGAEVLIYRSTEAEEPRHIFSAGVPFIPRFVDENSVQLLYAVQESVNDNLAEVEGIRDLVEDALIDSAATLRGDLAAVSGAGIVGYLNSQVYPVNTVGAALKAQEAQDAVQNSAIATLTSDLDTAEAGLGSVVGEVNRLQEQVASSAPLYFKSKVLEVGFRDSTYDALISTYGYDFLYPQAFAIDKVANELWVLKGASAGANSWAWIWVYDLTTGVRKTTFTTGQRWRESLVIRYNAALTTRYMYTIGNENSVIRSLVTALPVNLSTVAIANTYAVDAQSQMTSDGNVFAVQSSRATQGLTQRNRFDVWDAAFTTSRGSLVLPYDVMGTLQAYTQYFPKSQGICLHQGTLYAAIGGAYDPNNAGHVAARDDGIYRQGIAAFTSTGEVSQLAVSTPAEYIAAMTTLAGYPVSVCESEGVASDGTNLYSIQLTLGPTQRVLPANAGKGVVIVKEMSTDANRVSFLPAAVSTPCPLNDNTFQLKCHHSLGQLANPITNVPLTTFAGIVTMMRELGLSHYTFGGTNQTITDLQGAAVDVTGRLVRCTNINGSSFSIECIGATTINPTYFLSANGTVQFGPFYGDAEYGSNANGRYIKHANGVLECWYTDTAAQIVNQAAGSLFVSPANLTWTYPEAFVGQPVVTLGCNIAVANASAVWGLLRGAPGLTSVNGRLCSATTQPTDAGKAVWRAIGRWK